MLFRSHCPTSALVAWCRALKHGLGVGMLPGTVFKQQARSGPKPLRDVATRMAARLESGDSLMEALRHEPGRFPVLFVELIAVGEQSGRLTDVLGELESHYSLMQSARNRLVASLLWPAFSLIMGVIVIAVLMTVLGSLSPTLDLLGIGLKGFGGAVVFLIIMAILIGGAVGGAVTIANDENLKSKALGIAMAIPGLANCVRAFALQRFSMAWRFLAEAGLKADRTFSVSLRATANKAYREHETSAAKKIRKGWEVVEVMTDAGEKLFPPEYVEAARIGDETGQLAEVMGKQAAHYQEESERKLRSLAMIASIIIYGCIALLMIFAIYRIYYNAYVKPMNDAIEMLQGDPALQGGGFGTVIPNDGIQFKDFDDQIK